VVNVGKAFEKAFANSVPESAFILRLRDMGGKYKKLVNVKNICDYILYRYPTLFLLELKTTKGKSMPFDNLKVHQVAGLYVANKKRGIKGGFVFNFRDLNETYYLSAGDVAAFVQEGSRKSFPIEWCRKMGYRIEQTKVRTTWKYNIDLFLDTI
jgi:recombination protein U